MYAIYDTFNNFIALKSNMLGGGCTSLQLELLAFKNMLLQTLKLNDVMPPYLPGTQ